MRGLWIAAALVLLAGCQREKSFDERYAEASATISGTARDIDRELDARNSGGQSPAASDKR